MSDAGGKERGGFFYSWVIVVTERSLLHNRSDLKHLCCISGVTNFCKIYFTKIEYYDK